MASLALWKIQVQACMATQAMMSTIQTRSTSLELVVQGPGVVQTWNRNALPFSAFERESRAARRRAARFRCTGGGGPGGLSLSQMQRKVTHSCSESVPRDYQLDSDPDTQTHTHTQNVTGCTNACRRLPGVEPLVSPRLTSGTKPDRLGYYNRRSDGNAALQYAQGGSPELQMESRAHCRKE